MHMYVYTYCLQEKETEVVANGVKIGQLTETLSNAEKRMNESDLALHAAKGRNSESHRYS